MLSLAVSRIEGSLGITFRLFKDHRCQYTRCEVAHLFWTVHCISCPVRVRARHILQLSSVIYAFHMIILANHRVTQGPMMTTNGHHKFIFLLKMTISVWLFEVGYWNNTWFIVFLLHVWFLIVYGVTKASSGSWFERLTRMCFFGRFTPGLHYISFFTY